MTTFQQIRAGSSRNDLQIDNLSALGLNPETRGIHILWMYPDILNMHGGRGDAMALLHFSNLLGLPCALRRCNTLTEEIPFDWADMIFFPSGDLACMADVSRALLPYAEQFHAFAGHGKPVVAFGSSGALLARQTAYRDGRISQGLGLLEMELTQRERPAGDDLWVELPDGPEVLALQVQMADVRLLEGQAPFGQTKYGRGNCGDGTEGARTGNVIFSHCLGPVLPRNPRLAEYLLRLCGQTAGVASRQPALTADQIALENAALADVRTFVEKKLRGEISTADH